MIAPKTSDGAALVGAHLLKDVSKPHICHFFYTGRIFENQILHPKKRLKAPKTLKMSLKKSNICIFFHLIWKNLHLTENFYTDMSVVSVTNMRYDCVSSSQSAFKTRQ